MFKIYFFYFSIRCAIWWWLFYKRSRMDWDFHYRWKNIFKYLPLNTVKISVTIAICQLSQMISNVVSLIGIILVEIAIFLVIMTKIITLKWCHFISGLWTCEQGNLTAPGFCLNGQNHKTRANNLSHLPRNTKFDHQSHLSKNRFNRHGFYPGRLYPLGFYLG